MTTTIEYTFGLKEWQRQRHVAIEWRPDTLKNKIDGHEDYAKAEKDRDVIVLLVKIKTVMEGAQWGFAPLLRDLESDYALGQAKFPKTMEEVLQVMSMYTEHTLYKTIMKKITKQHKQDENDTIEELSFAQMTKRDTMKEGLCFKCKKHGHRAHECPNDDDTTNDDETPEQQHVQHAQQPFGWMQ